jgi:hypothetical protein
LSAARAPPLSVAGAAPMPLPIVELGLSHIRHAPPKRIVMTVVSPQPRSAGGAAWPPRAPRRWCRQCGVSPPLVHSLSGGTFEPGQGGDVDGKEERLGRAKPLGTQDRGAGRCGDRSGDQSRNRAAQVWQGPESSDRAAHRRPKQPCDRRERQPGDVRRRARPPRAAAWLP